MVMAESEFEQRVAAVRRFNRFYTKRIGVLHEGLLRSPFPLAQARVLYELAHHRGRTATALGKELGLDPGYLSRILRGFRQLGLVAAKASREDRRQSLLSLTAKGRQAFATLDRRSRDEIALMLNAVPAAEHGRLIEAMRTVEDMLASRPEPKVPYLLRPPQPGDMGWVVSRHGALYVEEYGWDEQFEALVATIVARFVERYDAKRERCWIAERDGKPVGSVFLVSHSKRVAQLRLLLVEPSARRLGIGARLVNECVRFARRAGYRRITLWTNSVLVAARHIYAKAGFRLVDRERHRSFGHDLIGETWELVL
jgi:DNA-binding MarR family transcriptional regulator/GNAT superfamily N-acetyltransferase